MKILHISDTHGLHDELNLKLDGVDLIVHSGDCSNSMNTFFNHKEVWDFMEWYESVPVKNKILVAGNHDTCIEKRMITKEDFAVRGITYLEHEEVTIDGIKFFGSPYTPTFGTWSFMKSRQNLHSVWIKIPDDINVLITHGPPKGIRDLTEERDHSMVQCGDASLMKWVFRNQPNAHLFGHLHNRKEIINQGISMYDKCRTVFSNATCIDDGRFGITSNGNIINL